jgi:hypothetical protein
MSDARSLSGEADPAASSGKSPRKYLARRSSSMNAGGAKADRLAAKCKDPRVAMMAEA